MTAIRRRPGALVLSVLAAVSAVSASSCSDRSTDGFAVINDSDVAVTVEFVDELHELTVQPGHREVVRMDDCLGTAVLVTATGQRDITLDGSACRGSVLYVLEDHTAFIESMYA
ncbi:adenosylhomocysteinase [Cellulomonas xylanilytica]|uniref:Lipoprotein n=1 Tax=Cellulomonas xylanilytica TaxID=233583 RepID=A0A510V882_9CELL|nr:adenosylhomocysteinase [Cellulomonas xylanilytica]GEK23072.1 hypothetical protein CXY01_35920 [Cellulomonas xylanilytica]